jgi:hypothetical protein
VCRCALCPHRCRSTVDRAHPAGPRRRGPGPQIYPLENNSLFGLFRNFAKRSLDLCEINPWSRFCRFYSQTPRVFRNKPAVREFSVRSEIRKIFTKRSLASENPQKYFQNFKNSYLFNHNSKSSDSCVKILRITPSFFLCIHITHVCCILLIDCMCLLHDR